MKVAFVQDWFNQNGGAEKVAGAILDIYEKDDVTIYALFNRFSPHARNEILNNRHVRTSILQYVPFIRKFYRYFLPVMPWLMKRFKLRDYDVILSTSHAVAKGFTNASSAPHICYCHTPLRPVWDMYDDYAANHSLGRSSLYKWYVGCLRKWDIRTSGNVNYFIANSRHIQQRIKNSYGRDATVIYPPVRVNLFTLSEQPRKDYYLCVGRVVPYKKMDMVTRAFSKMPDMKLLLIGEGWGAKEFESVRSSPNIQWLGYQDDAAMIKYIQEAKACIFAAKEDFGIVCVESQACGTPVLALDYGGFRETVVEGVTGYLFSEQTEGSIVEAVRKFEAHQLVDHKAIRQNALRFSDDRFRKEYSEFVTNAMNEFYGRANK